ncbi:MAG: HEAT repeat domain-containing protein [Deltaproteobacteria bacterium]|nr:HEAT repeat domain-containing protein [Deltaproteobacteria bacterium]
MSDTRSDKGSPPSDEELRDDPDAGSESETRGVEDGWFKPLWKATSRADDGFVKVARSIGAAARFVEAGVVRGVGAQQERTAPAAPQSAPPEPVPAQRSSEPRKRSVAREPETHTVKTTRREAPQAYPSAPPIAPPPAQRPAPAPAPAPAPRPAPASRPAPTPVLDVDGWLKVLDPGDRVRALEIRVAIDDWLRGSVAARVGALEQLVSLGIRVEPLFVASLRGATPEHAELALEGLRRIDSERLAACIAELLLVDNPEVRIVALRIAQQMSDRIARPLLSRGVEDPDPRVRRRVIPWLSWRQSAWAVERIWELCDDPDPSVKWAALDALVWHDGGEVRMRVRRARPAEMVYCRRTSALVAMFGSRSDNANGQTAPDRVASESSTARGRAGKTRDTKRGTRDDVEAEPVPKSDPKKAPAEGNGK